MDNNFPQLSPRFDETLKELSEKYGEKLMRLNGFTESQLNFTDFINQFTENKGAVADTTIDANANVSKKDILTLVNEMNKPHLKLLSFKKIFHEMEQMFGLERAKEWLAHEIEGKLYMHDAYSSSLLPYCFAYDLEDLVNKGVYFLNGFNSQPPKHLTSFVDFVCEFISFCTNRTSGAVGLPSFLIYSYYFWMKDVENGYYTKSPEVYRDQQFQVFIYRLNQPFLRDSSQSAFTNISIFDREYLMSLFGDKEFPDGSLVIDHIEGIIQYQKDFMDSVSKIRSKNLMTFPVLTISLLYKDGKFIDEDFARWAVSHNLKWADSNFFISDDVTSLSQCCRLSSNVKDLGYFNSIGGSALEVGSVKVNTINLARLAYEFPNDEKAYLSALEKEVLLALDALHSVRHIITRNAERGLLPTVDLGMISLDKLYNTVGVVALFEALQKYGYTYVDELGNTRYSEKGVEFAVKILNKINEIKTKYGKNKKYSINIEQIPGENAAYILMEKDKIFYPYEEYTLPLYGNQWIPLGVKTSLDEKIRLSAILDEACTGGSIAHFNLDAPITNFDTAWKLINRIASAKVKYFAFNVRISACKHNHGFYGETCPECGEPKVVSYQRIVGYLVPTSTYSTPRKKEFALRDWLQVR